MSMDNNKVYKTLQRIAGSAPLCAAEADSHKAVSVVSVDSAIKGNVSAYIVWLRPGGKVDGTVTAHNLIAEAGSCLIGSGIVENAIIKAGAVVKGDISAQEIVCEKGACWNILPAR